MISQPANEHAHYTHNSPEPIAKSSSVYCVHGFVRVQNLLAELQALGVLLSIGGDGRLVYDAPAGVMTDSLLARMRSERDGLLALVELVEERAAIAEYDGGWSRAKAEALAWESIEPKLVESSVFGHEYLAPMIGVMCPWCGSGERLLEHPEGLRCDGCGREAWRFEAASIVRADWIEMPLADWPKCQVEQQIEPEKKQPTRIERGERSLAGMMFES